MELDDRHHAWTTLEHRLDQQAAQLGQLREQAHRHAARASLRPLWLSQSAQLLCAIALGSVVAPSWSGSGDDRAAIIGGVLLQLWCVALALSALRQLQLLVRLDVAGPLLQTQQALAQLRRWRRRVAPLGMAFWLLWVAVADSLWRRLTGSGLPQRWLLLNAVFGVIGIWYGYRRLQRARHPRLDRLDDAHAGRGMTRATRLLAEIARFRRE